MLSKHDCLDFLNLKENEMNIIMEEENLGFIIAIKKCSCLIDTADGVLYLHSVFLNKFNKLVTENKEKEAMNVFQIYQGFTERFPLPDHLSGR